jgi:hypothetical protein
VQGHDERVEGCKDAPSPSSAQAWFQRPSSSWDLDEQLLAWGAVVISEKRAQILEELGFTASAGELP